MNRRNGPGFSIEGDEESPQVGSRRSTPPLQFEKMKGSYDHDESGDDAGFNPGDGPCFRMQN